MNEKQKQLVLQFFGEKLQSINQNPIQFAEWLMTYFTKPKADQKADIVAWLDERKVRNTAQLNALDAQKITAQDALNGENSAIDGIKNIL